MPKKMLMLRGILAVVALLAVSTLSSCKKYYSCTCTHDGQVFSVLRSSEAMRKKDVEKDCKEEEDYHNANGYQATCKVDKMKFEKI